MTGDGVNDAPALKQADCGTPVSGATDAAPGAAALILNAPGPSVINSAIDDGAADLRSHQQLHYGSRVRLMIAAPELAVTIARSIGCIELSPSRSSIR